MNEQTLLSAFDAFTGKEKTGDKITFKPEIKIKRATDTLYLGELRKTKINTLLATVEVYGNKSNDKAPMPVTLLDDTAITQILSRLNKAECVSN